ncbi:MAG: hypothetical protein HUK22_07990, partial [Thermoguttaceae bacterium]|nr:hypothetical protein [Thermoguttaceae bacterium]
VDGEFDAVVRVRNVGDAAMTNVDLVAQIPAGVKAANCAGNPRKNEEKRRVYWTVPLLRPGEEVAYRIQCVAQTAGEARFAVAAADKFGETAQSAAQMFVDSIADIAMRVKTPKAPVPVGSTAVYELIIANNGAKDANEIDSGIFLGEGLEPIEVEDGKGEVFADESKVIFAKVERLRAGESLVFRVRAKAVAAGNHKVQAMVRSIPEDASLMSEETTYCYDRVRAARDAAEKTPTMVASESGIQLQ